LNNQAIAIGDPVLPLAKGNVLRRVDNTNGGALLGTAYRNAVENDVDANGNRRTLILSRNGGKEPSDPLNPNPVNPNPVNPSTHPIFPPPFGCTPPPSKCFWTTNPMPPDGFQNYGSAVVNENALPLYLHCIIGTSVPKNLNCSFLDPQKWSCFAGVCSPDPNGIYNSQAQCEAAFTYYVQITGLAKFFGFTGGCSVTRLSKNHLALPSNITGLQWGAEYIVLGANGCGGTNASNDLLFSDGTLFSRGGYNSHTRGLGLPTISYGFVCGGQPLPTDTIEFI
jgi:hypothetical protein